MSDNHVVSALFLVVAMNWKSEAPIWTVFRSLSLLFTSMARTELRYNTYLPAHFMHWVFWRCAV